MNKVMKVVVFLVTLIGLTFFSANSYVGAATSAGTIKPGSVVRIPQLVNVINSPQVVIYTR